MNEGIIATAIGAVILFAAIAAIGFLAYWLQKKGFARPLTDDEVALHKRHSHESNNNDDQYFAGGLHDGQWYRDYERRNPQCHS